MPLKKAVTAARTRNKRYGDVTVAALPPWQCFEREAAYALAHLDRGAGLKEKKVNAVIMCFFVRDGTRGVCPSQCTAATYGCSGVSHYDASCCFAGSVADDTEVLDSQIKKRMLVTVSPFFTGR